MISILNPMNAQSYIPVIDPEPNERAEYDQSLVTYVDILGFKDLIARRDATHVKNVLLYLTRRVSGDPPEVTALFGLQTIYFSDLIVRTVPLQGGTKVGNSIGTLFFELRKVANAQRALAARGTFIRGGIVVGNVYHDGEMIFGPGLISRF
jgi:hypothetical protein